MITSSEQSDLTNTRHVFRLLVLYRWLSLIPPLLSWLTTQDTARLIAALAAAVIANLFITFFPSQLNASVRQRPALLLIDLVFCSALAAFSSGWNTPYYLYAFSPLLAAAFFFKLRGALVSALGMALLFVVSGVGVTPNQNWLSLVAQVVGFFLIAGAFGYATTLMARLTSSHLELNRAHRDLEVIHSLTLSLQSASDVNEVEERVLEAVTNDLGFSRAVIALVDQNDHVVSCWLGKARDGRAMFAGGLPHPARLRMTAEEGIIAQCLLDGQPRLGTSETLTANPVINTHLEHGTYHVFPMILREHPVGVLIVNASDENDPARLRSLEAIASQAAVAVGTTMLCIDRAQRLAVQDERIRIAREIHDTVSQSLFGMTFSLDACVKLLPTQPDTVKKELASLLQLAESTRAEVRQSIMGIWPSQLNAESFATDLRRYTAEACRASGVDFDIQVRGDFESLPPQAKRGLYRIAQEALANVVRHANATQAQVRLDIADEQATLAVQDNGRGFDLNLALAREFNREHFGLRGILDRATSLHGTSEILTQPGTHTIVKISVPLSTRLPKS
ncbi:MAG: GAF domain-containing sensor histidine kinase [Chloroflexi bacterium]|nr:GAF domain-containing sensor histidine kinase [Chloroflexota bacterium]